MSRAAQKAATKAKLSAIARKAFQHDGYEEVTFRSLATAAGTSTGAFFSVWKSKAAMFSEVMDAPAPDVAAFLAAVAIRLAGTEYESLGNDALELRRHLIGQHG